MEATTYQEDFFNIGIRCCISDQANSLGRLPEHEYDSGDAADSRQQPALRAPALRPRGLSSKMPASIRKLGFGKSITGKIDEHGEGDDDGDGDDEGMPRRMPGGVSPTQVSQSVAHRHFLGQGVGGSHEAPLRKTSHDSLPARVAADYDPDSLAIGRQKSLLDEEDAEDADINKVSTDSTCSESCPPSPHLMVGHAPEDALAVEVGNNAFEYLEECFYTEVSVLDRAKFNAIPEIVKSDFTIMRHLGKGNFSDVFEVVRKVGQPVEAQAPAAVPGTPPPPNNRRRPSRARRPSQGLSASVTTATLARPSCGARRSVFALKCLRPGIRSDADQFTIGAEDLVHETAILATLDHPHIIKLYGRASGNLSDAFVLNDGYFILLDRLSETLYQRMDGWKQDPECLQGPTLQQIEVAHSVADAMGYLHSKKIVFRDLKPDNVGFDSMGVLKMFDFGFGVGLPEKDEANPAGFLFDRCGTPRYMAPEVGLSLGYGLAADVYSFGILFWEVCAMAKPFASITSSSEFERAVFMEGKRPAMGEHWPTGLRKVMCSCWSASPSKRPKNWNSVKSSLSSLMGDGDGEKKIPSMSLLSGAIRSKMKVPNNVGRY
eukprot:CAMPEP_0172529348 /NCGR_PEP_ID=MMETSP1067-20121228/3449_1 /TAXON_ID=265564 ORGANISM="Thalassiosira punctigera, Strain Tpunct2005C2" /NCGR_SAMPLE_ID=MMETSP1067 /ASSEMBLY_ACC=CAM_ASM_000444 /LENGTH=602 /DNA_ID=CAMNT_0013313381 /DNA_START=157 /DNA_END=1965 /DNA_ORIENTATION=-